MKRIRSLRATLTGALIVIGGVALLAAIVAVPAAASVPGGVSEYWGTCPDLATTTSSSNPYSLSPGPADYRWPIPIHNYAVWTGAGPSLTSVHADATALTMASSERAAHPSSGSTTWCQLHGDIANVLTVGAGTSGLNPGDPVTVVLITTLGGGVGGWGDTSTSWGTSASASVKFGVKDGYTTLASYTADGYADLTGIANSTTVPADGKYDVYLYGNNSGSHSETPNEQQFLLGAFAPGAYASPYAIDFGTTIGSRTIRFDTYVGATLNLEGSFRTDEQAFGGDSAGTADLDPGFTASFAADPANSGISLTLATDATAAPTTMFVPDVTMVYGAPMPLSAYVGSDAGTPTGSVSFTLDGTAVGSATLDATGWAQRRINFAAPYLATGQHALDVSYGGADGYLGSTGASTITVVKAATSTVLGVSPIPTSPSQPVTLTASVATVAPGGGDPTGAVTFKDGSTVLGITSVVNGVAKLVVAGKYLVGYHVLTATYGGDANHGASIGQRTIPKKK